MLLHPEGGGEGERLDARELPHLQEPSSALVVVVLATGEGPEKGFSWSPMRLSVSGPDDGCERSYYCCMFLTEIFLGVFFIDNVYFLHTVELSISMLFLIVLTMVWI